MKGRFLALAALAAFAAFAGGSAMAGQPDLKGNGLPYVDMSEAWKVNVLAFDNCPTNDFDGTNRRTIAVQAHATDSSGTHGGGSPDPYSDNDILLSDNGSLDVFTVADGNACDDDPALLELPALVATKYDVYIKLIGKLGTIIDASLCVDTDLTSSTTIVCNVSTVRIRGESGGRDKFTNADKDLLYFQGTPIFDSSFEGEFWDWSTGGQAKAQLWFLPCNSDTEDCYVPQ